MILKSSMILMGFITGIGLGWLLGIIISGSFH